MLNKTFFSEIEAVTADARQRLETSPAILRCLDGQVEMETYKAFLIEAYHHVKHTVPAIDGLWQSPAGKARMVARSHRHVHPGRRSDTRSGS